MQYLAIHRFDYMILNVFAKIEMSIEIQSYIEIKENVRILFQLSQQMV